MDKSLVRRGRAVADFCWVSWSFSDPSLSRWS